MPDAFFVSSKPRKRKRTASASDGVKTKSKRAIVSRQNGHASHAVADKKQRASKKKQADEQLDSDRTDDEDDLDLRASSSEPGSSGEEDEETPAGKRLRLAKLYLDSVKHDLAEGEFDAAEIDKEVIASRLKQDVLEHSGKVHLFVADAYNFSTSSQRPFRGHRFSITSAVASESGQYLFTAGKEGSIIKWDLHTGSRKSTFYKIKPDVKGKGRAVNDASIHGHTDEVWALTMSSDGKYLVSAGKERKLCVWDAEKAEWIKGFGGHLGHKDSISALSFRIGTHQLYSASFDRTVKVYDLDPTVMGYVETLFGHQDHVIALDSLRSETCVSVGARDKTVRFWKIVEESQLVFRGGGKSRVRDVLEGGLVRDDEDEDAEPSKKESHKKFIEASLECVAMVDETTFLSGGDSGLISLWSTQKKKPIFTHATAHGLQDAHSSTEGVIQTPRWITAIASLRYSDLFASGSWDGQVRLWKLDDKLKSFRMIAQLPVAGVINSLQFIMPPRSFFESCTWTQRTSFSKQGAQPILLVVGIGQEHRLGRWVQAKEGVHNGAVVFAIYPRTAEPVDHSNSS
ncbi:WD40 repeat-like protein [Fistulina hepatica ATCC 64428]|uniref:WD40 repeat-like protein n=1 Tax=Fistulina hepatica ATCC 64428 TaxID=1128425 RepID=A0A0D7AE29_9AGAR|nr:WD40 repeat-like protein [Fistulina hepatica ATCC 64428]